jgi:TPR repeat protein
MPKGIAIRVRWNHRGEPDWDACAVDANKGLEDCIGSLAERFLQHLNPELAGRAFLQERNYGYAFDAFRQWAISEPRSSEAFAYLAQSLAAKGNSESDEDLKRQETAEAITAAQWADPQWERNKVVWLVPNQPSAPCIGYSEPQPASDVIRSGYYRVKANLSYPVTRDQTGKDRAASVIVAQQLEEPLREDLPESESLLKDLNGKFPLDSVYLIDLGVTREDRLDFAGALRLFKLAEAIEPGSAGVQRNIGVEYLHNAFLPELPFTAQQSQCFALQHDNFALHLSLNMLDALPDAIEALNELRDDESALILASLMHVIYPENRIVIQQYALAFATAGQYPEALDAFTQGLQGDPHSRDLASAELITSVDQERGTARALPLAKEAADRWKESLPLQLALSLERGRDLVNKKSYQEALSLFDKACQLGNGDACQELGLMYFRAEGVYEDDAKAVTYWKRSCDEASVGGCSSLGAMYADGTGVDHRDYQEALSLDTKACAENWGNACYNLGRLYEKGLGVAQNNPRAAILFAKACFQGSDWGCSELGQNYLHGTGVAKDPKIAKMLLTKGCDLGNQLGCDGLKETH